MKKLLALFVLITLSIPAFAEDGVDLKVPVTGGDFSWKSLDITQALIFLNQKSRESCPSGFEKLREYTTREGEQYFLHFVVKCLTPATPSATDPSAPK